MADQVINYTKDGEITSGNTIDTFSLPTDVSPIVFDYCTGIVQVDVAVNFNGFTGSSTEGGRWGGAYRRRAGTLLTPSALQKIYPTGDQATLVWTNVGQNLQFTLDVFYDLGVSKLWRAWIHIYLKDDSI